jgi:hypothetical protein
MLQVIETLSADWVFRQFQHELAVFRHVSDCFGLLSASFRVCCFGVCDNLTTPILVNAYPRRKREECYLQVTSSEPNNLITCVELSWVESVQVVTLRYVTGRLDWKRREWAGELTYCRRRRAFGIPRKTIGRCDQVQVSSKKTFWKASAVLGRKKVVSKFKEEVSRDFGKSPRLI